MVQLDYPKRKYIVQVARFDPAKGIDFLIHSYAEFRKLCKTENLTDIPQLVVCGNSSIDDPDASIIYDSTMSLIEKHYPDLAQDISVMRLDPNDQILNMIIANAHVVLQLSSREGFEVKVSEALHAGRPVIATMAGGIPLQIKDKVNGFLVASGNTKAVAGHLLQLFSDDELWKKMSYEARTGVSDEIGTVGNALSWYYLAVAWAKAGVSPGIKGDEKWVNDMAREGAGRPYREHENKLPRRYTQKPADSEESKTE